MDSGRQKRIRRKADDATTKQILELLHTGGISIKGLATLIRKIQSSNVQALSSFALYEANLARFMVVRHIETVRLTDGGDFEWEFAHPAKLVSSMIADCPELERLFLASASRHPCDATHRWRMIIGFDEYVPGNKLKTNNQRKCMNLSFTFLELECLRQDAAWFTPIVLRHSYLEKAEGGWGALLRRFLNLLLFGDIGFSTSGLALELGGQPFLLFAEVYSVLGDLDGHRMAWDAKGANALRLCLLHPKVLKLHSEIADTDASYVEISCSDVHRFGRASSRDIYRDADLLVAAHERFESGAMTQTRYNNLQKVCGLNYAPHGVFRDRRLREHIDFARVITVDWVHCMLADGVLTVETYLLISAAHDFVTMSDLENYMKGEWCFPAASRAKSRYLWQVFQTERCPSGEKLKASASEMLGLYSLLRHFVETRLRDVVGLDSEKESFFAVCHILDVITLAKQGRVPMVQASDMLQRALTDHLEKHKAAYGTGNLKPKHHYMFDVACQWRYQKEVVDAFVVERLHLRVKTVAELVRNTETFERSCMGSLINSHCQLLQNEKFGSGLVGRCTPLLDSAALIADTMCFEGMLLSVGDIIFHEGTSKVCNLVRGLSSNTILY